MIRLFLVLTLCAAASACSGTSSKGPSAADKSLVRAWLKANLGTPNWEEIKWDGPVSATSRDLDAIERLLRTKPNPEKVPDLRTKPRRYVRLKYRHERGTFGTIVSEQAFDVSGKEAMPVSYAWEKLAKGKTGV
jgi:hypothetical protein